jgi:plastocyanin
MRNLPRRCRAGLALLIAVLPLGCDRSRSAAPTPAAAAASVPAGPGVITGVVHFSGTRPEEMQAPGECCPGVAAPPDETVVVNPNGTLRNVTVYLKDGPNVATAPPAEAVLAQDGCRYVPHVLALRAGQKLVVTNHDPTLHNVHIDAPNNTSDNFGQNRGDSRSVTFDHPDDVEFKCDVHAWMRAHVMVFAHPCYAVTGDDGSFRIDRLPPGTYTLVAHHEEFGDLEQTVTVTAEKPAVDAPFEYHP